MSTDKKGQSFLRNFIRPFDGFRDLTTGNRHDFDGQGTNAELRAREINAFDKELAAGRSALPQTQLGDSYNRDQQNKDIRNMLLTNTALREYESGREAQRMKSLARDFAEMTDVYAQTAADRRLMEDRSSPTKISQQILRARTGEAALMDAVARQGNTAVNIATAGLSPRGRAGGR